MRAITYSVQQDATRNLRNTWHAKMSLRAICWRLLSSPIDLKLEDH